MTTPDSIGSFKIAERPCPLCAAARVEVLHHQSFALPFGHILPSRYDVVCCIACGFAYADTPASQADYDLYYAQCSKYDDAATSTGGGSDSNDAARLQETAQHIADFLQNPNTRILDAGCALGGLLHKLKRLGYANAEGLDPSPTSAIYAREHFGVHVSTGSIIGGDLQSAADLESFDCVILSHVLEHVRDLESAFENLQRLTRDGSTLYLEVPDAARYRDCMIAPFQDFNIEHINHFDAARLDLLAARFGFECIDSGSKIIPAAAGIPYPALWAFYRRTGKIKPNPGTDDQGTDGALRAALLDYIARSRQMLDKIEKRLRAALAKNPNVVVWGVGQLALKLLSQTSLQDARIICFLDGNPVNQNKVLAGVPVIAPEDFLNFENCNDESTPIIIASTIHQDAIARRIRDELMWNNPLVTLR